MKIFFSEVFDRDIEVIRWQIKAENVTPSGIVERCEHGYPAIILLNPAPKNTGERDDTFYKNISNLLWLTCPYLNEKIHGFENAGYIERIQNFINNDRLLLGMMENAHADYFFFRKNIYHHFFGDSCEMDEDSRIFNKGIGGIWNTDNLKCLHQHYSHYRLCEQNIAGRIVYHMLNGQTFCSGVNCNDA